MEFKQFTLIVLRKLHLLPIVTRGILFQKVLMCHAKNNAYSKAHNIKIPPYSLMIDAYGHCMLKEYHETGLIHANFINDIILQHKPAENITVCEWGCGAARILQHLKSINSNIIELIGTDYNPKTILWCKNNINNITFVKNDLKPPFLLKDKSIDVLYCISVFTHLSEVQNHLWINEIKRVLKENGLFIGSFHGEKTFHKLTQNELKQIQKSGIVERGNVKEGSGFYVAYHSDNFIKNKLLNDFKNINKIKCDFMLQDVWCAMK